VNRLLAMLLLSWLLAVPALAHRLDEYLQATMLSVEPEVLRGTLRLVPGVAVASAVIANMDVNADGDIDEGEQITYADRLISDLTVTEDGRALKLHRLTVRFPANEQMRSGRGEIRITFDASLASTRGTHRISFVNRHKPDISVYLVNAMVPQDERVRIQEQKRTPDQASYDLTFTLSEKP
jgi:hypothetical protein